MMRPRRRVTLAGALSLAALTAVPAANAAWVRPADGPSPINHLPTQNATDVSVAQVAGVPYVAWRELDGGSSEVRVSRLTPTGWQQVGATTDPASPVNRDSLGTARDVAIGWKKNIAKFDNEQYKAGIDSGEFHLVQGYAGDLFQVAEENGDLVIRIPEEGALYSCDDLVIPKDAASVDLAYAFINFLTEPDVAAENMDYIVYRAPNKSAYPLLGADFRSNEVLFPPAEVFAKMSPIDDLGDALPLWTKTWDEIKAA